MSRIAMLYIRFSMQDQVLFLDNSYADADIQGAFSLLDENVDGRITTDELKTLMSHMKEEELQNLIREEDVDENGTLEYKEFLNWVQREALNDIEAINVEKEVREVFELLDSNGDHFLSPEDLQRLIPNANDAREMIREQDIDGDGQINYDEFVLLMNSR